LSVNDLPRFPENQVPKQPENRVPNSVQFCKYFDSEFLKASLARLAAELSTPPSQKNMAVGSIMMAMRHAPGMARPRGGTGALVQVLVRCVQALNGEIRTDQRVQQVLVHN